MSSYEVIIFIVLISLEIVCARLPVLEKITGTWYVAAIGGSEISVEQPRCWIIEVRPMPLPYYIEGTSTFSDAKTDENFSATFVAYVGDKRLEPALSKVIVIGTYGDRTLKFGEIYFVWINNSTFTLIFNENEFFKTLYLSRSSTYQYDGTSAYPVKNINNILCPWHEIVQTQKPDYPDRTVDTAKSTATIQTAATSTIIPINGENTSFKTSSEYPFHNISTMSRENILESMQKYTDALYKDAGRPVPHRSQAHRSSIPIFFMFLLFFHLCIL